MPLEYIAEYVQNSWMNNIKMSLQEQFRIGCSSIKKNAINLIKSFTMILILNKKYLKISRNWSRALLMDLIFRYSLMAKLEVENHTLCMVLPRTQASFQECLNKYSRLLKMSKILWQHRSKSNWLNSITINSMISFVKISLDRFKSRKMRKVIFIC